MCFFWTRALLRELSLELCLTFSNVFMTKFSYCTTKSKPCTTVSWWSCIWSTWLLHCQLILAKPESFWVFHSYTEPRAVWHGTRLSTNVETPSLCLEKCRKDLMENSVSQGHGIKAKITWDRPAGFRENIFYLNEIQMIMISYISHRTPIVHFRSTKLSMSMSKTLKKEWKDDL